MRLAVNSSLPRSGSELLQALLAQHPEIYASATSPLLEYWYGAWKNYDLPERKSQDPDGMLNAMRGFCRQGAVGYYGALTDKPVVVDKSRGWLQYAELLWSVFPDARLISMVREPLEIVASLERIYQNNPGHPETMGLPRTAEERTRYWLTPGNVPLGLALQRLKERQAKPDARVVFIPYEALCEFPVEVMREVFNHLQVDPFDVDPNNVVKAVAEDHSHYGIFGHHAIRPRVEKRPAR